MLKTQTIKQINKLANKPDRQLKLLVNFYKNKEITVNDIVKQADNSLDIKASVINDLAVELDRGLEKDEGLIFKLYVYAADKGSGWANRNLACCYFQGRLQQHKSTYIGTGYLKKSIEGENKLSSKDLLAEGKGYLKKNPEIAIAFFKMIETGDTNYGEARKLIQQILSNQLKKIYERIPIKTLPTKNNKNIQNTQNLDKCDIRLNPKFITNVELSKLELDISDESLKCIGYRIHSSLKSGFPIQTIDELFIKEKELEVENKEARKRFEDALIDLEDAIDQLEDEEIKRQVQTEKHFFSPHRTQQSEVLTKFAEPFQKNRVAPGIIDSIDVTNTPARRIITAEISTIEASLKIYGRVVDDKKEDTELGWHVSRSSVYNGHPVKYGKKQTVDLGSTEINYEQKANPHCNHLGDYLMDDISDYNNILKIIEEITDKKVENEKKLAKYMLRFSKKGSPAILNELKKFNPNVTANHVDQINKIFYHCFVKEPARWMLPKYNTTDLPFATAQIRAVKLIKAGKLKMKDVFKKFSDYGVFTDEEIGKHTNEVKMKMKRINRLYIDHFLKPETVKHVTKLTSFFKEDKTILTTTRQTLHSDLIESYGGENDTDGEGYDSDTANKLYKNPFEF